MDINDIVINPLLDTLRLQKIDDATYFSEKYNQYVSNSRLSKINPSQEGSYKKFLDGLQADRIFNTSLTLGSAIHAICLQEEFFELVNSNKPTNKAGFIADECISLSEDYNVTDDIIREACKIVDYYNGNPSQAQFNKLKAQVLPYIEFRKEYKNDTNKELIYLDNKQYSTANACIEAINKNKNIQSLLHPVGILEDIISENEQAILLDVEVKLPDLNPFIVRLKSKLDNYTIDSESNKITVNDIKTHGKILPEFPASVLKYHYYREIAMYSYLLNLCSKKFYNIENPTWSGNFLVVSTIPTYYTKVFPMTKALYVKGFEEFKYLLRLAAIALYFKDENKALEYERNVFH